MEHSESITSYESNFVDEIFESSEWLLLSGPRRLTEAVAFRIANELAFSSNGNSLFICRDSRHGDTLPLRVDVCNSKYCIKWSPILLKNIDIFHANNSPELKRITALVHTLQTPPDLIIIESLSAIIDPLNSVSHSEHSFQHLLVMIKSFIEDAARVVNKQNTDKGNRKNRVKVIITDEIMSPILINLFNHRAISHGTVTELSLNSAQVDLLKHANTKKHLCNISVTEFVSL